jgi:protein ATS1
LDIWTPLDVDELLQHAGITSSTKKEEKIEYEPVAIGCSWTTSFIVFSRTVSQDRLSDIVLSFGTNDFGELGCGTTTHDEGFSSKSVTIVRLPGWQDGVLSGTAPKGNERMFVEHLAVGQRHMVCVCQISSSEQQDSGRQKVYGWGAARHGQLSTQSYLEERIAAGTSSEPQSSSSSPVPRKRNASTSHHPTKPLPSKAARSKYPSTQTTPVPIDLSDLLPSSSSTQITNISCGASHTVLLLSDGRLLGLGNNAKGQLDLWRERREEGRVHGVGCTWNGTVGWSFFSTGEQVEVWSTGSNTHGQLGRSSTAGSQAVLLPESTPSRIRKLICGSEHVLLLTNSATERKASCSKFYGWGWNEHGNLALGTADDQWTPVEIPVVVPGNEGRVEVLDAWAGCGTCWVLAESE